MSDKADKSLHKKKNDKLVEGRKYAVVCPQSIISLSEACGVSGLSDDIANKLSEDVTYHLREIIQLCCVHMRNSKERRLRSVHVARVLPKSCEVCVSGYLAGGSADFIYVPEADVYISEETQSEVNLPDISLTDEKYEQKGELFVKGVWFLPDEINYQPTIADASDTAISTPPIPSHLISYYTIFAKAILCKQDRIFHVVFEDLMTNSNIGLVVPYFLNLLIEGLQELPRSSIACKRLLLMVHALTQNPYVYRDAIVIISGLVTSLLVFTLDPQACNVSLSRDFELRELAAGALAKVVSWWYCSDADFVKTISQKLVSVLLDSSSSLRSHYGALVTFCALGEEAVECCLWLHLEQYLQFINILPVSIEVIELYGCLLSAAEFLYKHKTDRILDQSDESGVLMHKIFVVDRLLYLQFGDSLCARRRHSIHTPILSDSLLQGRSDDASSNTKDSGFELEYRNWVVTKLPKKLNLAIPKGRESVMLKKKLDVSYEFELPEKKILAPIKFGSIRGAPPWCKELKRRAVDQSQHQFKGHSLYVQRCYQVNYVGKKIMRRSGVPRKVHFSAFSMSL